MKKTTYIKPEVSIVNIAAPQLLAGSTLSISTESVGIDAANAPELPFDLFED